MGLKAKTLSRLKQFFSNLLIVPSQSNGLSGRDLIAMFLVLAISLFLFSHWIWRPISPDEREYLSWGFNIFKHGKYQTIEGTPVVKVPPLHSYVMAAGFHLFGPNVDSAQAMSMVFGCLTVGLVYLYGVTFWGWRVGLMGSLLLITAAKGEFWRYSNRVLNDIHLTFFVFLMLYFLALFWRHGRWWTAAGAGISLGLGLLTKELAALSFPLLAAVFLLCKGEMIKRVLALAVALLLALLVLLPWLAHVAEVTGSMVGGTAQRADGHALEAITSGSAWGLRSVKEIWNMVRFFDKPSSVIQLLYLGSLLFGGWVFWKSRSGEVAILLGTVAIWYLIFSVFVALPFNSRRFLQLLPIHSVLLALLLEALWLGKKALGGWLRMRPSWLTLGFLVFFCVLLIVNLRPHKMFRGFDPFSFFCSSMEPHYKKEIDSALRCLPTGASVLSNYPWLTYFYSQGAYSVRRLNTNVAGLSIPWVREGKKTRLEPPTGSILYDFNYMKRRVVMDEDSFWRKIRSEDSEYILFIRTGHPIFAPEALHEFMARSPNVLVSVCRGDKFQVYKIDRSSLDMENMRTVGPPVPSGKEDKSPYLIE